MTQPSHASVKRQTSRQLRLRNIQNEEITSSNCWKECEETPTPASKINVAAFPTDTPQTEVGGKYFIYEVSWRGPQRTQNNKISEQKVKRHTRQQCCDLRH